MHKKKSTDFNLLLKNGAVKRKDFHFKNYKRIHRYILLEDNECIINTQIRN